MEIRAFISYRRQDAAYAAASLRDSLELKFGSEAVFIDYASIPAGRDYAAHLVDALLSCNVMLVLIGDRWIDARDDEGGLRLWQEKDWVRLEIEAALERSLLIVPVLLGDAVMPQAAQLPTSLQALVLRQGLPLRAGSDLKRDANSIIVQIEQGLGVQGGHLQFQTLARLLRTRSTHHLRHLADSKAEPGAEPVRPKRKFNAAVFVARDEHRNLFREFLADASPCLVISGEAGCGKTSVLCDLVLGSASHPNPTLFIDAFQVGSDLLGYVGRTLVDFTHQSSPMISLEAALHCVEAYALDPSNLTDIFAESSLRKALASFVHRYPDGALNDWVALVNWMLSICAPPPGVAKAIQTAIQHITAAELPIERLIKKLEALADTERIGHPSLVDGSTPLTAELAQSFRAFEALVAASSDPTPRANVVDAVVGSLRGRGIVEITEAVTTFLMLSATADVPASIGTIKRLFEQHSEFRNWLSSIECELGRPGAHLAPQSDPLRSAIVRVLTCCAAPRLIVAIDAINETTNPEMLRGHLAELAQRLHGRLGKLVVTCRTPDLRYFIRQGSVLQGLSYGRGGANVHAISPFTESELQEAWPLYRAAYGIAGDLGIALAWICRTPLMLRLFCEAYADGAVPRDDVRQIDIFELYWQRKIATGDDGAEREVVVAVLADACYDFTTRFADPDGATPLEAVGGDLRIGAVGRPSPLHSLVSEGVVVYLSPTPSGAAGVRFTYEAFHEYVIAARVLPRQLSSHGVLGVERASIRKLVRLAERNRLARGALEYVAIGVERRNGDPRPLFRAILKARKLRALAAHIIAKLRDSATTIELATSMIPDANTEELALLAATFRQQILTGSWAPGIERITLELLRRASSADARSLAEAVLRTNPPWLREMGDELADSAGPQMCIGEAGTIAVHPKALESLAKACRRVRTLRNVVSTADARSCQALPDWVREFADRVDTARTQGRDDVVMRGILETIICLVTETEAAQRSTSALFRYDGSLDVETIVSSSRLRTALHADCDVKNILKLGHVARRCRRLATHLGSPGAPRRAGAVIGWVLAEFCVARWLEPQAVERLCGLRAWMLELGSIWTDPASHCSLGDELARRLWSGRRQCRVAWNALVNLVGSEYVSLIDSPVIQWR